MFRLHHQIFTLLAVLLSAFTANAQTEALLQFIHNSADPALAKVDIYINSVKHLDDFEYLDATTFEDAPGNILLNIGIAPATSSSVADTLKNFTVTLQTGGTYIVFANGVLNPPGFAPNPNGLSTALTLVLIDKAREKAQNSGNVDFALFNGSTDAAQIDINARGVTQLANDIAYGVFTDYQTLAAGDYIFDVTDASGARLLAAFKTLFSGVADSAAVIFTSGFLHPATNQDGPEMGMFAALASGEVLELESLVITALLQIVHNSADPVLAKVDFYLDGSLHLDDFEYLDATTFDEVPGDVPLKIGIAPATSSSVADTLKNFTVTLQTGGTYIVFVNGVLNPPGFAPNPDGLSTALTLILKDNAREKALTGGNVDFVLLNGATDAPPIDIVARGVTRLANDLTYNALTGYLSLQAADYIFDISDSTGSDLLAAFKLPFFSLADSAAVVFTTGFFDPGLNQNGQEFGMFAVQASGDVLELVSAIPTALLQFIHNSADTTVSKIDIYINDELFLNDFKYLSATTFDGVPGNVLLNVGFAPATSTSVAEAFGFFTITLNDGVSYVAIFTGLVEPSDFAPNPDGLSTALTLVTKDKMRKKTQTAGNIDFIFFHGSTDAPKVDVSVRGVTQAADDVAYGNITGYSSVPVSDYVFDVTDATVSNTIGTFRVQFSGTSASTAVVFSSGFINPTSNQAGAEFGLFAALTNGDVLKFEKLITDIKLSDFTPVLTFDMAQNYPNPFNASTTISFVLPETEFVTLKVFNILGQDVATILTEVVKAGHHKISFDAGNLPTGIYYYQISVGRFKALKKFLIIK